MLLVACGRNGDKPTPTSTAAPGGLERPTFESARLADPGVVIERPAKLAWAGVGTAPGGSTGNAEVKQPNGWTEFSDDDGGWDVWGDDGSWSGYSPSDGYYAYDPASGQLNLWDDAGNHHFIDSDGRRRDVPGADGAPPASPGGGGGGDPHYVNADGTWLSTQLAGELVLRSGPDGHNVQVRQQPRTGSTTVAVITAVAVEVGTHHIGVYLLPKPRVLIDGREIEANGPFTQVNLSGGGAVGVWTQPRSVTLPSSRVISMTPGVAIVWPDLSVVRVNEHPTWRDIETAWAKRDDRVTGILGPLVGRDGVKVADTNRDAGIAAFIASWRVRAAESLFTYGPGESTEGFVIARFPDNATPTALNLGRGESACRAAGVTEAQAPSRCAYDIAITGDNAFLDSHVLLTRALAAGAAVNARLALASPSKGGAITLTAADRTNAKAVVLDKTTEVKLAAGEHTTVFVDVTKPDGISLINEELSCTDAATAQSGGYQVFNAAGTATSKAIAPCAEPADGAFLTTGRHYVVFEGPASGAAITIRLRFRDLTD